MDKTLDSTAIGRDSELYCPHTVPACVYTVPGVQSIPIALGTGPLTVWIYIGYGPVVAGISRVGTGQLGVTVYRVHSYSVCKYLVLYAQ